MGVDPVRVLHVDDDPDLLALAAEFLETENDRFELVTATSAGEGLEVLAADEVDCVVSDYDMPSMDGLEFLAEVRERRPELPFILFTGKGSEEIASEAISAGVTDYLQKRRTGDQYTVLANRITNAVDRYHARRELERTHDWYETLFTHSSDYVFVVDEDGAVRYVSPAVERIMGYPPEELTASNAFDFTHPDDLEQAGEAFFDLVEDPDGVATVEFRARHADGSWRWLEVRGRNLFDDPVIEGIVVNARDITDRKRRS